MVDDSLLPHIEKIQSAHHVINLQREEIARLTYWMRSAYVIKIELNTKLIFTDLEDNRVSINGLDNVTITVSWNSDIVESQTCSFTVLFLL
jgi:hypothetical protein